MDKQDKLAAAILAGLREPLALESGAVPTPNQIRAAAAAVRSYMGSDEVVERAALVIEDAIERHGGSNLGGTLDDARAALSAALDIGGGRGS